MYAVRETRQDKMFFFFSQSFVDEWNSLPSNIVESPSTCSRIDWMTTSLEMEARLLKSIIYSTCTSKYK